MSDESQPAVTESLATEPPKSITEKSPIELFVPISSGHITFMKVAAWLVMIVGVIGGLITLLNAPKAPEEFERFLPTTALLYDIKSVNRIVYVALGWSQIIGSVITGSLLLMVANIGKATLDLWIAHKQKEQVG